MNIWTLWILASAVFLALYDLAKKASVRDNAVLPVLLVSSACGCLAFTLSICLRGDFATIVSVDIWTIWLALSKSLIVSTSWIFTFCALRTLPITIATPIRASSPALVFVAAFSLYGEIPSLIQAIGMITVFIGYWLFSWAGRHEGIDFLRNRAVWFAIAGALCSAFSAIWDKYVFQIAKAPVEAVQFYFQIGLVLVYAVLTVGRSVFKLSQDRFEWRWTIPLVGTLLAAADWLYFTGLAIPEVPISVASLMRRFSVVITFVLGAMCFHERNLCRKGLALTMVVVGIIMLGLR